MADPPLLLVLLLLQLLLLLLPRLPSRHQLYPSAPVVVVAAGVVRQAVAVCGGVALPRLVVVGVPPVPPVPLVPAVVVAARLPLLQRRQLYRRHRWLRQAQQVTRIRIHGQRQRRQH